MENQQSSLLQSFGQPQKSSNLVWESLFALARQPDSWWQVGTGIDN